MHYHIDIQNEANFPLGKSATALRRAAETALHQQNAPPQSGLTLVITDEAAVHALNAQFRHTDAPTDVLSFPAAPLPLPDAAPYPYLGDVIIAYPRAAAQAQAAGHSVEAELLLLAVHGVLHLLGFDHDSNDARAVMWTAQAAALAAIGAPITGPSE